MFSQSRGIFIGLNSNPWVLRKTPAFQSYGQGMMRAQRENGDELPSCFLERRRLGCPLPRAIRVRAQRPHHVAVGEYRLRAKSRSAVMSTLPPKANIHRRELDVRLVKADTPFARCLGDYSREDAKGCNAFPAKRCSGGRE